MRLLHFRHGDARASAAARKPKPTDEEIRNHMQTNLCRCGTHAAIMRAIKRAAVA